MERAGVIPEDRSRRVVAVHVEDQAAALAARDDVLLELAGLRPAPLTQERHH